MQISLVIVPQLQTCLFQSFTQVKNPFSFHYCRNIPMYVTDRVGHENILANKINHLNKIILETHTSDMQFPFFI